MSERHSTQIQTEDGARIIKRLCNHWKHKFEIEEHGETSIIPFPDAQVKLTARPSEIDIEIYGNESEKLQQYQGVVIAHINRMAQQEFDVEWTIEK